MSLSWDEAVAYALTLPDTLLATAYGKPAVKLAANGRGFLATGHEPQEAFCLLLDRDTVAMLIETDPETFFQTPHYAGFDAVLVRYATRDPERVRAMIALAREQAAAKKPARPRNKTPRKPQA
ncbi:MAG TPA: hypothetical protein VFF89_03295 [Sphingobium sp.]|nr:hypothetical protein [Sphingobium sp.]